LRLLVTRPLPEGERTAEALRARGHDVTVAPLLEVELLPGADLGRGPYGAVLMTSGNAARAIAAHPRLDEIAALPVFAVGRRSAEAARQAGFARIVFAGRDSGALEALAAARLPPGTALLYLAGENRAGALAEHLAARGFPVHVAVVYRAAARPALPAGVRDALRTGGFDGVLHFSARSAETFLAAAAGSGIAVSSLNCKHFCISAQVAGTLRQHGVAAPAVASRPEEAAVLDLVGGS